MISLLLKLFTHTARSKSPQQLDIIGVSRNRMLIVVSLGIALLQGCAPHVNLRASEALSFEEKTNNIPLSVNVYISPETMQQSLVWEEKLMGTTATYICPIGSVLGANINRALTGTFKEVTVQSHDRSGNDADISIEISFGKISGNQTMEGIVTNRRFIVTLNGKAEIRSPENLSELSGVGTTYCEAWTCYSGSDVSGKGSTTILLKSLFLPFYFELGGAKSDSEEHLSNAVNAAVKQAIVNIKNELINYSAQYGAGAGPS